MTQARHLTNRYGNAAAADVSFADQPLV